MKGKVEMIILMPHMHILTKHGATSASGQRIIC